MPKRKPTPEAAAAVNVSGDKPRETRPARPRSAPTQHDFVLRVVRESGGNLVFDTYHEGGFRAGGQLCRSDGLLVVPLYVARRYCDRGSVIRDGESQPQKWVILCLPLPRDLAQLESMVDNLEANLLRVDIADDGALPIFDRMLARKIGDTTAPLWAQRWRLVAIGDGLGVGWTLSPALGDRPMPDSKEEAMLLRDLATVVREAAGDGVLELDLDWFAWKRTQDEARKLEEAKKGEEAKKIPASGVEAATNAAAAPPSGLEAAATAAQ